MSSRGKMRGGGARGSGRGRGGGGRGGRGRGGGGGSESSAAAKVGGDLINVGIVIRYANGDTNTGRKRWPSYISEEQALETLLSNLPNADLNDIVEVSFSQTPRVGVERIHWMDDPPNGKYYFNQHLQYQYNNDLRNMPMVYDPDIANIQYQGSITDYLQRPQDTRSQMPVGPRRYDPDAF